MRAEIHPQVNEVVVRCACGNSFQSTSILQRIEVDICSNCHPLFTGQQRFVDTAGRIEKFQARYKTAAEKQKK